MNAERRERIGRIGQKLRDLQLEVSAIRVEEEDSFCNLPESLQDSEKGDKMQECMDSLERAYDSIDDALDALDEENYL